MSAAAAAAAQQPFPSLDALRMAHNALLKRYREEKDPSAVLEDIHIFLNNGRESGAYFDGESERENAQSLLDYWVTVLHRAHREPPDATLAEFDPALAPELDPASRPYLGLAAFHEANSAVFFGRERLVADLSEKLSQCHFLPVLGASGSGKSSLVLGGILPALRNGRLPGSKDWFYYPSIVPGSHPLLNLASVARQSGAALEAQAAAYRGDPDQLKKVATSKGAGAVLTIDQFEEIFTLCTDPVERAAFADNLLAFANSADFSNRVIVTMRTDFEEKVALLPQLASYFSENAVHITPLSGAELREAIEKPAARVGLKFEDGIVDELVKEVLGQQAGLPLLQFTLFKLWQKRDRNRITFAAYRKLGNVRMALGKTADEFYSSQIPENQTIVKRVMMRLVRPSEGLEVTSNRVRVASLAGLGASDRVSRVVGLLIDERLLRLTEGESRADDQVEVAHEALIRNWPRLVEWLEQERVNMRTRLRLTAAAEQWREHDRDPGGLLGGSLLSEAAAYDDLNEIEIEFVKASQDAATTAEREKEQARQKELEAGRARTADLELAAKKQAIYNRRLSVALAFLGIALIFALHQTRQANRLNDITSSLLFGSKAVEHKAKSEQIEAAAAAVYSYWLGWDKDASIHGRIEDYMRAALGNWLIRNIRESPVKVNAVAVSPDGRRAAYGAGDGGIWLTDDTTAAMPDWYSDNKTRPEILALETASGGEAIAALQVNEVEILPFGKHKTGNSISRRWNDDRLTGMAAAGNKSIVAIGTESGDVILWDYRADAVTKLPKVYRQSVAAIAIDSNATLLAAVSYDKITRIWIWNLLLPGEKPTIIDTDEEVNALEFKPGAKTKLAAACGNTILFWDDPVSNPGLKLSKKLNATATAIGFLADGRMIAGNASGNLDLVDLKRPESKRIYSGRQFIKGLAGSGNGTFLAGDSGGNVLVGSAVPEPVEQRAFAGQLAWSASMDGEGRLILGGVDGEIGGWSPPGAKTLAPGGGPAVRVAVSGDGNTVVSGDDNGTILKWHVAGELDRLENPARLGQGPTASNGGKPGEIGALAVSAGGEFIAASERGHIWTWNRGQPFDYTEKKNGITAITVSADGCWLAYGMSPLGGDRNGDSYVRLRPMCKNGEESRFKSRRRVSSVAFSPDGGTLAFGTADGEVSWFKTQSFRGEPTQVHSEERDGITALAFGRGVFDGILVAGDEGGLIRGWNIAIPNAEPFRLRGHESAVKAVGFRKEAGEQKLISVDAESRVLMWRHASRLRSLLCIMAPSTAKGWEESIGRRPPSDVCPNE